MTGVVRVLKDKAPVLVLTTFCAGAAYAIFYAHYQQVAEKKFMRQGVINDIKRDRLKRRELEQRSN